LENKKLERISNALRSSRVNLPLTVNFTKRVISMTLNFLGRTKFNQFETQIKTIHTAI